MRRNAILLSIHILSALIVLRLLIIPVFESLRNTHDPENLRLATRLMPGNALGHYNAGLLSHYGLPNADNGAAINHYEAAVKRNPLYSRAWFHLGRAYKAASRIDESLAAIENFYRLNPRSPGRTWDTGIFYLGVSGRIEKAMEYFKKYLELEPESQSRVYDILTQMDVPNKYIINNLLSDNASLYPQYLKYLMRQQRLDHAQDFWNNINRNFVDEQSRISFCEFLLAGRRYDEAWELWKEMNRRDLEGLFNEEMPFNGGFEEVTRGGCFDWMVDRAEGVSVYFDSSVRSGGYRSLGISFDGKHNVDIYVIRQHLLLDPGAYVLTADLKTNDLTTTNGLFFEARGRDCSGFYSTSEVITGTTLWNTVSMNFSVPPDCRLVDISLRRHKSRKLNNKIGGNAWVDEISLHKMDYY